MVSFIGGGDRSNRRNHQPATSHWQTLSLMLHRVHLVWAGFEFTTLLVICTDYIGRYKSNCRTITTTTKSSKGQTKNNTQKTNNEATRILLKRDLTCSGRVNSFCSTCATRKTFEEMTVTYPHFLKKSVTRFKALVISIAICIKCMLDSSIMRGNVYVFILFKVYMLNNCRKISPTKDCVYTTVSYLQLQMIAGGYYSLIDWSVVSLTSRTSPIGHPRTCGAALLVEHREQTIIFVVNIL